MKLSLTTILYMIVGVSTSIIPTVLLTYGISQFNIIRIVGQESATWWFSLSLGVVNLSLIFLNPLGGYFFDKLNSGLLSRRIWITLGSIFGFISMIAFSYSYNIPILIVFWVLTSFSYGLVSLLYFSIIPELYDFEDYGKVSGLMGSLIPLTIMLLSVIIFGGFSDLSVKYKIILTACIQLIFNLAIVWFVDFSKKNNSPVKIISINKNNKDTTAPKIESYNNFIWTLLSRLSIHIVSSGLSMMTLFYIARFHLSSEDVFKLQSITSLGIVFMIVSGIVSGYVSDRKRIKKPFIIFSAISLSVCMCLYSISYSIVYIVVISYFYQLVWGVFNSVDQALVNQVLPSKEHCAKDLAIMNTTNNIAKALVSFATPTIIYFGRIWMRDDGYTLFFLTMAAFSILSAIFVSKVNEDSYPG
ncbi:MFS transporter [Vibrio xiamenensis]|nr:MFS transporter [Vibrio xiamenensis]